MPRPVIFIHGLNSSNKGKKSIYFKERFPHMIIPHFTGSFDERMQKLYEILSQYSDIIIIGSSYGGLMATVYAMENESKVSSLILLAPALNILYLIDYPIRSLSTPTRIYHGINDMVIPIAEIRDISKKIFPNLSFFEVDDDHYLYNIFYKIEWDKLLNN